MGVHSLAANFAAVQQVVQSAAAAITDFARGCVSAAADVQETQVRFETLLGSAAAAKGHVQALNEYAASTPFELGGISRASAVLLAFGVQAKDSMGILRMLGDVAAGSGGSLEELARVFGKVNTAGKMDTADINQLGDRGLNVRQVLAERDNLDMAQVRKNISAGLYGVEDLLYVLERVTGEGGAFYGATDKLSKTFKGMLSTFNDNITALKVALGELALPTLTEWLGRASQQVQAFEPMAVAAAKGAAKIGAALDATFGKLPGVLNAQVQAVKLCTSGLLEQLNVVAQLHALEQERERMAETPINPPSRKFALFEDERERMAKWADIEPDMTEREEKRREAKRERILDMRSELARERDKRDAAQQKELFASQNAEGMRHALAYRFEQATGQKWGGGFGEDEQALLRAEEAAAKNGDRGAMSELAKLREYTELYKKTQQKEIDAKNDAYEAEKKRADALSEARRKADAAMERANLTLAGDAAGLRRLDATGAALALSQQYRAQGMSAEEADSRAAEIVATQNAAQQAGLQKPQLITQSKVAVGGGGHSIRLGDAQLDVAKQGVGIMKEQKRILEDLRQLLQNSVGSSGIPVVS